MTEKQKSIPEDALDEKGKRKRYRERRPQMPFDQEVQKAAAVPIGRKTANFDYNKNRKERREKQLNSTKSSVFSNEKLLQRRLWKIIIFLGKKRGSEKKMSENESLL